MVNLIELNLDVTISDIVVSGTYIYDGYYWYGFINLTLVIVPTLLVQIFSVRWFQMDSMMKRFYWYIHASLLGVVHRCGVSFPPFGVASDCVLSLDM